MKIEPMNPQRRGQRVSNACRGCRRRKIRCSGSCPCDNCTRRNDECQFDDEGRKVVVSQRYLRSLQQAVRGQHAERRAEKTQEGTEARSVSDAHNSPERMLEEQGNIIASRTGRLQTPVSDERSRNSTEPSNPLAATGSSYVADGEGWLRWLGESSTWSFSHKTLMLVRDNLEGQGLPLPDIPLNEESRAYSLSWGCLGFEDSASFGNLPSKDHAIYLLNGIVFHIGPLYHLYDETKFMDLFHAFYASPIEVGSRNKIWYCQFLTLLALAKALSLQPTRGNSILPGTDLFLRAVKMLPDPSYLISDCLTSIETLCTIALYLQCADQRNSAYIYIGQALRIATTFGLHRDRSTHDWGSDVAERAKRAWWTVYVLDRTFSSSMGVPISIQDFDITTTMPQRDGPRDSMALFIHVKLSNLISDVINKVYGAEGRLRSSFLPCVHKVLEGIASIAGDLNGCFPLSDDMSEGTISRLAAHLHLFYHQIILQTMYPLILYLFQSKLQSEGSNVTRSREFSETTSALLRTCGESCKRIVGVLALLQQQNILGGALPFDLERAFSSGFVLVMLAFIYPDDTGYRDLYFQSCQLLDELINRGCRLALLRKGEVEQLYDMIQLWNTHSGWQGSNSLSRTNESNLEPRTSFQELEGPSIMQPMDFGDGTLFDLSPGPILSLAQMLDTQEIGLHDDVSLTTNWMWQDTAGGGEHLG